MIRIVIKLQELSKFVRRGPCHNVTKIPTFQKFLPIKNVEVCFLPQGRNLNYGAGSKKKKTKSVCSGGMLSTVSTMSFGRQTSWLKEKVRQKGPRNNKVDVLGESQSKEQ